MRLVLLMTAALFLAHDVDAARRGSLAFHYARPLTPAQLDFYGRFDLLVTHDPLPRAQVDALHARGTRLLLYEWSIAFYPSIAGAWQRALPQSALLNAQPLRGHLGAPDADAYYYDPASRQHERERAGVLAAKLRMAGYDGVFFDTTAAVSVHPQALAEYNLRHPGTPYDVAFARFLRVLRRELKNGVIVTNQGYRAAPHILPFVDVDVTESLITRPVRGRFVQRPWREEKDLWNSASFLVSEVIGNFRKSWPAVRFVHLNYLDALDQASVARVVAIARLYGDEAFVAQPSIAGGTLGSAYFVDLGAPRALVEAAEKGTAYRFFAKGLIAVNFGKSRLWVPNPKGLTYENVVTREKTRARRIAIPPGTVAMFRQP